MVLRHVVHYKSSHLCWVIHACSVVVRIRSPDRRQHRWNSSAIASMAPGALCSIDGFAAGRVSGESRQFDKAAPLVGLALHRVLREPVDICDQSLQLSAVLGHRAPRLTAGKALLDPIL